MAEVTMSLEEYLQLVERDEKITAKRRVRFADPKPKRKGTPLKGMASALKKANKMARKKNGSFKKGWSQAKVMKKAHQIRRRAR